MNELMKYEFRGNAVRVVVRDGEPWWVAKDVCDVLELGNSRQALVRLDEDEKSTVSLNDGTPGNPNTAIVTESGLYSLILGSRKPEARVFKRWVTHDVLPDIRKHGMYATDATLENMINNPDLLIEVATRLRDERKLRLEESRARLEAESKVKVLEPKAEYYDRVADAVGVHSMGEAAKLLGTGRNRLFTWLRKEGVLMDDNVPYQSYIDGGHFKVAERTYADPWGGNRITTTTYVTGKGMTWLQKRLHRA